MLPGAGAERGRGARRRGSQRARGGSHRRGLSAPHQRRHLDLSVRRSDAQRAPAGSRPGALRRQERRQEPGGVVPRRRREAARGDRDSDRRRGRGRQRRGRGDGSVLTDVVAASAAIEAETTVDAICDRLCKSLVFVVGATACSASRVVGDYLVDATEHALREVWLGDEAAYRIADFPLTAEALRTGEPRAVSFLDGDVDPAEAFILRELGMNALLLLPLARRRPAVGARRAVRDAPPPFTEDDVAIARFLDDAGRAAAGRRREPTARRRRGPRSTSFRPTKSAARPRTQVGAAAARRPEAATGRRVPRRSRSPSRSNAAPEASGVGSISTSR